MAFYLRDYQIDGAEKAAILLQKYGIAYLVWEVRVGKTVTALQAAENYGATKVLWLTKKKAIASIEKDFLELYPEFFLRVINYEQLHTIPETNDYDLVVCDEAQGLGQFPIKARKTQRLKNICKSKPIIFCSGTPTAESYSQLYHQFWISSFSPFKQWTTFYSWAKDFVTIGKKYFYGRAINDYSNAKKEKIDELTKHLFLSFTQAEAGFEQYVQEEILYVEMNPEIYGLCRLLQKNKIFICRGGDKIIADSELKLMQKMHQIYSGTVILETSDKPMILTRMKANFIKDHFKGKKIAIFYQFRAEEIMLREVFGVYTTSPEVFNENDDLVFIAQFQSGREGTNLSTADCIVCLNIDFSATSYWQARARLQTRDRKKEAKVYWIFSIGGIEDKIYKAVSKKKNYTLSYFKRDYVRINPKKKLHQKT